LPDTQALTQKAYGGTVTNDGSNTIHTFNSSGDFYTGSALATGGDITFVVIILFTHSTHQAHSLLVQTSTLTT
jgi:hypothetical protein